MRSTFCLHHIRKILVFADDDLTGIVYPDNVGLVPLEFLTVEGSLPDGHSDFRSLRYSHFFK